MKNLRKCTTLILAAAIMGTVSLNAAAYSQYAPYSGYASLYEESDLSASVIGAMNETAKAIEGLDADKWNEWKAVGIARAHRSLNNDYYKALRAKIDAGISKITDTEKAIMALSALGLDADAKLLESLSSASTVKKAGITSMAYALIALDSRGYEIPANPDTADQLTREDLVKTLVAAQKESGGYGYTPTLAESADVTAMVLQALVPYTADAEVKACMDKGINYLEENVPTTGDLCCSAAQTIILYTMTDHDVTAQLQTLMQYYDGNGGFTYNGKTNTMTTEQAYLAMVAYNRSRQGKNSLYDMRDAGSTMLAYADGKCVFYSNTDRTADFISAKYDADGRFIGSNTQKTKLESGQNRLSLENGDKLLIWEDNAQIPVCDAFVEEKAQVESVSVSASVTAVNTFLVNEDKLEVSADLAESYGYTDNVQNGVSGLDVLVRLHEIAFAEEFTPETATEMLQVNESGWLTMAFGDTGSAGFLKNHAYTSDMINAAQFEDGESFEFFFYNNAAYWTDYYTHTADFETQVGTEVVFDTSGWEFMSGYLGDGAPVRKGEGIELAAVDEFGNINPIDGAVSDADGKIKYTFTETGEYKLCFTGAVACTAFDWSAGIEIDATAPVIPSIFTVTVK